MKRTSRFVGALVLGAAATVAGTVEPAFAATGLVTLEAEAMTSTSKVRTDSTASGGRAVTLSTNGALSASVGPASPVTGVTVRAKGDQ
jgi:hypothetical protein